MDNITLISELNDNKTVVSNNFLDNYMPYADGEFVKIYLYLIRSLSDAGRSFNISNLAEKFDHTDNYIMKALIYWERAGLINLTYNSRHDITSITILDDTARPAAVTPLLSVNEDMMPLNPADSFVSESYETYNDYEEAPTERHLSRRANRKEYSEDEVSSFTTRDDVAELLFVAEKYLGRLITPTEQRTLLYWVDELKLSIELISYLIEFSISRGQKSFKYMDKIALNWAEEGISTVDEAKLKSTLYSTANHAVIKAFGIKGRVLTDPEIEYVNKWTTEYGFSLDIIAYACSKTIMNTHNVSFAYADSILADWKKKNVSTLDDINRLDEEFKNKPRSTREKNNYSNTGNETNKFKNFAQRDYDFDELEKHLLNRKLY